MQHVQYWKPSQKVEVFSKILLLDESLKYVIIRNLHSTDIHKRKHFCHKGYLLYFFCGD